MKGTATKILDRRFSDFIEALQKLGELQSTARMINCLSHQEDESWQGLQEDSGTGEQDEYRMLNAFWQMGWIEVREITKQSKSGLRRRYVLKVCLEEIVEYLKQDKLRRKSSLTGDAFQFRIRGFQLNFNFFRQCPKKIGRGYGQRVKQSPDKFHISQQVRMMILL